MLMQSLAVDMVFSYSQMEIVGSMVLGIAKSRAPPYYEDVGMVESPPSREAVGEVMIC